MWNWSRFSTLITTQQETDKNKFKLETAIRSEVKNDKLF